MNVTLTVIARTAKAETTLRDLTDRAEKELARIFGHESPMVSREGRVYLYNSAAGRTWRVPTNVAGPWGRVAFTMPPVPLKSDLRADSWEDFIKSTIVQDFRPQDLSPNYFGTMLRDSELVVWTDHLGLGRSYITENSDFIAVSNHIGVLTLFMDEPVRVDEAAV